MHYMAPTRQAGCRTHDRFYTPAVDSQSSYYNLDATGETTKSPPWVKTDFTPCSLFLTVGSQSPCQLCKTV